MFNLITQSYGRLTVSAAKKLIESMNMKFVPIISWYEDLRSFSVPEILKLATGASLINPSNLREGIVFRSPVNSLKSFKAVSPEYDLGGSHATV